MKPQQRRTEAIIETGEANAIDPYGYLVALFQALLRAQTADDYEAVLHWRIALTAA